MGIFFGPEILCKLFRNQRSQDHVTWAGWYRASGRETSSAEQNKDDIVAAQEPRENKC